MADAFEAASARHRAGRLDLAERGYLEILEREPDHAGARMSLAALALETRRPAQAREHFLRALQAQPQDLGAWRMAVTLLHSQGHVDDAVMVYREALSHFPREAAFHHNLGVALATLGRIDEAAASYQAAVTIAPDMAESQLNLGAACRTLGRLDEALAALQHASRLRPDWALVHAHLAGVYEWQARHDDALDSHRRAMALAPQDALLHGNYLFTLLFHPQFDAARLRTEHAEWNRRHAAALRSTPPARDRDPSRRLRVGYVSGAFRDHVLGRYLWPLLREHDPSQVEVTCYSNNPGDDAFTERFRTAARRWRDVQPLDDETLAALIRDDGIDVLVDTTLHMQGNRLLAFARKPAPVQVTFAGYPGTTGLEAIDYRLSDPYLDAEGAAMPYSETTWRLPATFWCYDPCGADIVPGALPAIAAGHVTFGCLNNFSKTNKDMWALWARVLHAVPRSRLRVLAHEGSHRQSAAAMLAQAGIDPARLEFVGYGPREQYLREFHRIDVSLDTVPYNGHTTSLDSLWMGVPVVTLAGGTVVGRAGMSVLSNLGMAERVAHSPDEYVAGAVRLAERLDDLATLRSSLRARMERSPLMDAAGFARAIESAYRGIWRRHCGSTGENNAR